jgi:hypothetical protein
MFLGGTVLVGRGADRDELDRPMAHRFRHVGGKPQAAGSRIAPHQRFESRFVNRYATGVQQLHLVFIEIEAEHVVAEVRETRARDQSHVAGADDRDLHCLFSE